MVEPYFHVGILVRDVDAARADFTAQLGVEFEPVRSAHVGTGEMIRCCYSYPGPPYIELAEMTGAGSWSADQPEGFHHIGLIDPDLAVRCRAFGPGVDLLGADGDGVLLAALTPPEALHGIRVEYFETAVAARWLGRLAARTLG